MLQEISLEPDSKIIPEEPASVKAAECFLNSIEKRFETGWLMTDC